MIHIKLGDGLPSFTELSPEALKSWRLESVAKKVESMMAEEEVINLQGEMLTDVELIQVVLPALVNSDGKNSKWHAIDLRFNRITGIGIRELALMLRKIWHNLPIKGLFLDGNNLGDSGLKELCSVLGTECFAKLEILTVGFNLISCTGVKELAKVLPDSGLKLLSLDCNSIADSGLKELARHLGKKLQSLHLNFNQITADGVKELTPVLQHNSVISELCLSSNNLGNEGVKVLSQSLINGGISGLRKIDLCGAQISDEGLRSLIGAVKYSQLDKVDLSGNNCSVELMEELFKVLSLRKSKWFKTMEALLSVRNVPRVGRKSPLQSLPTEIVRAIGEALPKEDSPTVPPLVVLNFVMLVGGTNH